MTVMQYINKTLVDDAKKNNFGFDPIVNELVRGQNDTIGSKLFKTEDRNHPVLITGSVVAQTSVSNVYSGKIIVKFL